MPRVYNAAKGGAWIAMDQVGSMVTDTASATTEFSSNGWGPWVQITNTFTEPLLLNRMALAINTSAAGHFQVRVGKGASTSDVGVVWTSPRLPFGISDGTHTTPLGSMPELPIWQGHEANMYVALRWDQDATITWSLVLDYLVVSKLVEVGGYG